jgi:hypothetical protein
MFAGFRVAKFVLPHLVHSALLIQLSSNYKPNVHSVTTCVCNAMYRDSNFRICERYLVAWPDLSSEAKVRPSVLLPILVPHKCNQIYLRQFCETPGNFRLSLDCPRQWIPAYEWETTNIGVHITVSSSSINLQLQKPLYRCANGWKYWIWHVLNH